MTIIWTAPCRRYRRHTKHVGAIGAIHTSAKNGDNVNEAFMRLTKAILKKP